MHVLALESCVATVTLRPGVGSDLGGSSVKVVLLMLVQPLLLQGEAGPVSRYSICGGCQGVTWGRIGGIADWEAILCLCSCKEERDWKVE